MPQLIALFVFLAATASFYAVLSRPKGRVQQRLAVFKEIAANIVEEEPKEPEPGLLDRVGRPAVLAARRLFSVVLPSRVLEKLKVRLTLAGDPFSLQTLLIIWGVAMVLLPGSMLFLLLSGGAALNARTLIVVAALAGLAFKGPSIWLSAKAKQRQKQILKSLPDAIDLLTTSVEAGLGIDAALGQVAEKVRGPISTELRRVLRDMAMGLARREALKDFARRTQVPDVQQFVNAIVQAEQMGVSLGQVIRVQADQMRTKRRQRAEQQAYKAPVKMVFPLVLFIFPAIFVVVLGPAAIQIMESGLGS